MGSAVNRKTVNGNIAAPHQRLTALQALRAVTIDAAYSLQLENEVGTMRASLADLTDNIGRLRALISGGSVSASNARDPASAGTSARYSRPIKPIVPPAAELSLLLTDDARIRLKSLYPTILS